MRLRTAVRGCGHKGHAFKDSGVPGAGCGREGRTAGGGERSYSLAAARAKARPGVLPCGLFCKVWGHLGVPPWRVDTIGI